MDPSEIKHLVESNAERLAPGRWETNERSEAADWTLELTAKNGNGAPLHVHMVATREPIDVLLGAGHFAEIFFARSNEAQGQAVEELRDFVAVAVGGVYSEELWYRGRDVVRARGYFAGSKWPKKKSTYSSGWWPRRRGLRREVKRYAPY